MKFVDVHLDTPCLLFCVVDATSDTSYRNPVCQPQVALNASGEGNLNPTSQKTPFCAPANLSKSKENPFNER